MFQVTRNLTSSQRGVGVETPSAMTYPVSTVMVPGNPLIKSVGSVFFNPTVSLLKNPGKIQCLHWIHS